ncbi:hypothetical protein ACFYUR_22015 [Micromonospora haikouensis]|uniref:phage terminase small subunit n=1 Tax=Micromonospora TaxID=1873 RepID=UPI0033D980DE
MPGPAPKHPSARARRNRTSTSATLSVDPTLEAPKLPTRLWHEQTRLWWRDVWSSPMAPEYDESDRHGLFALAVLVDDFWTVDDPKLRKDLAAEIRQQRQCFGLTPIDRRRLQWEIERSDEAQDRGRRRRSTTAKPPQADPGADPRSVLRVV